MHTIINFKLYSTVKMLIIFNFKLYNFILNFFPLFEISKMLIVTQNCNTVNVKIPNWFCIQTAGISTIPRQFGFWTLSEIRSRKFRTERSL